jgi:hypothetical protein
MNQAWRKQMMTEAQIAGWARALNKKERLILATYEGGTCMPESMERYWNARALESLIMQEIVKWTMAGYALTEDGILLARYLDEKETINRISSGNDPC